MFNIVVTFADLRNRSATDDPQFPFYNSAVYWRHKSMRNHCLIKQLNWVKKIHASEHSCPILVPGTALSWLLLVVYCTLETPK